MSLIIASHSTALPHLPIQNLAKSFISFLKQLSDRNPQTTSRITKIPQDPRSKIQQHAAQPHNGTTARGPSQPYDTHTIPNTIPILYYTKTKTHANRSIPNLHILHLWVRVRTGKRDGTNIPSNERYRRGKISYLVSGTAT